MAGDEVACRTLTDERRTIADGAQRGKLRSWGGKSIDAGYLEAAWVFSGVVRLGGR